MQTRRIIHAHLDVLPTCPPLLLPPGEDTPVVVEVLAAYQEATCAGQRRGYASVRRYYQPQVRLGMGLGVCAKPGRVQGF
jgi:hypothetical protein